MKILQSLHYEGLPCNGASFEIEQHFDERSLLSIPEGFRVKTSQLIRFLVEWLGLDNKACKFSRLIVTFETGEEKYLQGAFEDKGEVGVIRVCCQNNHSERELLETIAHEAVHAYQWGFKRLYRTYRQGDDGCFHGCSVWEKSFFDDPDTDEQYHSLPWEQEAFSLQGILVDIFNGFQL